MAGIPRRTRAAWVAAFLVLAMPPAAFCHEIRYVDVTETSGIGFTHEDGRSGERYYLETLGAGAAWIDYDNDGDIDVYLVNGADLPGMRSPVPPSNALYRNEGDGTFTDISQEAGVGDTAYGFGCAVGDYDNDGFRDIYVANYGPNVLYRNLGRGVFEDVSESAGVGDDRWAAAATWGDYDNDGLLDLFVSNYVTYDVNDNPECGHLNVRLHCGPARFRGSTSVLYRNQGDGRFADVTASAGLHDRTNKGMGAVWCDLDNDGDLDLFLANDRTPNRLYRNNGDGTFEEGALLSGVALGELGIAMSSMAPVFADFANDGWLDLALTTFQDEPTALYENTGSPFLLDVSYASGLATPSLPYVSWGAESADVDSDGHVDLLVANGHLDENVRDFDPSREYAQPNHVYRNRGDGTFEEVSASSGPGFALRKVSRSVCVGDYDNDGRLDALVTNSPQSADLLRNETPMDNHWLTISTVGTRSNRDGVGARISVAAGGRTHAADVRGGGSYPSHSDQRVHFGLGASATADTVEIRWPSGLVERFEHVAGDRFLTATEGEGLAPTFD